MTKPKISTVFLAALLKRK